MVSMAGVAAASRGITAVISVGMINCLTGFQDLMRDTESIVLQDFICLKTFLHFTITNMCSDEKGCQKFDGPCQRSEANVRHHSTGVQQLKFKWLTAELYWFH